MTSFVADTWADGVSGNTPITAAKLTNLEQGILNNDVSNPASQAAGLLTATYAQVWRPLTAYLAGAAVVNPTGDVVTAIANFTSGASYVATNWNLSPTYAAADGVFRVMRPAAYAPAGVLDWQYNSGLAGYLLHFTAGSGTVASEYAIAIGTDAGLGGGILLSHKNAGTGINLDQQPGAGNALLIKNRTQAGAHTYVNLYAGGAGEVISFQTGAGYADGVATISSTTFTSATAAFVSGDVGATLTCTQPTPNALPVGVTIVSVTNATTVVLSAAPAASTTAVRFIISGRVPATTQGAFGIFDTDGTLLYQFQRAAAIFGVPIKPKTASAVGLQVQGQASQTADLFQAITASAVAALTVTSAGLLNSKYKAILTNAVDQTQSCVSVRNVGSNSGAFGVEIRTNALADNLRITDSAGSTIYSRINKDGYYITAKAVAPADADLAAGDMALWFDPTNGASKLMIKAKQADGTVKTGSVALA